MADAPVDLEDLKADLGILDSTQDEWLQRRVNAVWSRMEAQTSRRLCAPPATFTDDWGRIAFNNPARVQPPDYGFWVQPVTVFLRQYPVATITSISVDDQAGTPGDVSFDPKTGKLFNIRAGSAQDLSRELATSRVVIGYTAGWATLPPDLYEIVLGSITPQWQLRQTSVGGGMGTPKVLSLNDVGSIELDNTNAFIEGTLKGAGAVSDPLLGPYASMLDLYVDHRSRIGWAGQPVTEEAAP